MRKILVRLTGEASDAKVLQAGLDLGRRLGAVVDGAYVRPTKASAVLDASPVEAMTAALGGGHREDFDPEGEDRLAAAEALFAAAGPADGAFRALIGLERLVQAAALADVLIEMADWPTPDVGSQALFHILGESGRPVLLPGAGGLSLEVVAVLWDDGPASARSLASATPLLAKAGRVALLHEAGAAASVLAAAGDHLKRHGIEARFEPVEPSGAHATEAIAVKLSALGAGLLVMAAYRHGHLEEELFGGLTQDMLADRRFALLLRR